MNLVKYYIPQESLMTCKICLWLELPREEVNALVGQTGEGIGVKFTDR